MTLSVPQQAHMASPNGAVASFALSGGASQSAGQDGSAAFLGALNDAAKQNQQSSGGGSAKADSPGQPAAIVESPPSAAPIGTASPTFVLAAGPILGWRDQITAAPPTDGAPKSSDTSDSKPPPSAKIYTSADLPAPVVTQSPVQITSAADAKTLANWRGLLVSSAGAATGSDKTVSADPPTAGPPANGKKSDPSPDASSALSNIAWASLLLGATGAPGVATPASSAPAAQAATSASTQAAAKLSTATAQPAMPSDAPLTTPQPAALAPTPAPVEAKVVRSITYLGLDPTARGLEADAAPSASAPKTTSATSPAPAAGTQGIASAAALAAAQSGRSSSSGGGASQRNYHGASGGASDSQAPAAAASVQSGASAVSDANVAAMVSSSAAPVSVDQIGDVIANAAADLRPQPSTTAGSAPARTAPIKELDVQLNPASLGNLTIEMRLSEGKLAVTIKAEKSDTQKLIDGERSSISDKLASLNFTVESVTVKSAEAPTASAPGTNPSNSGMASNGGTQQGLSGQGGDGAQSGGSLRSGRQQSAPQARDAFAESSGVNSFGDLVV